MLTIFGPMAIGVLAGVWWAFFSRASFRERWQGLLEVVAIGVLGFLIADKSMRGMSFFFYPFPLALAMFLIVPTVLVSGARSGARCSPCWPSPQSSATPRSSDSKV